MIGAGARGSMFGAGARGSMIGAGARGSMFGAGARGSMIDFVPLDDFQRSLPLFSSKSSENGGGDPPASS
jgi:hypothetical protein